MLILQHLFPTTSNPEDRVHLQAIGLGLAAMGTGLALGGIYDRRVYAYAGIAAGLLLTLAHWDGPVRARIG